MKIQLLPVLAAAVLLLSTIVCPAAETNAVSTELKGVVDAVRMKIVSGRKTEAELADEMKRFDQLLADHKGEKSDDVAQVLLMKAMIYIQVFDQPDKGMAMITQLKSDFPDTAQGRNADQILSDVKNQMEARKTRDSLGEGISFPDFQEQDLTGKAFSVASYRGKIVLIDFWATWCRPCWREIPVMLKAYEAHHKEGFEILGVSLDEDRSALEKFLKERNISWPQYFDGHGWRNKLAASFGVDSLPANYLLDAEGKIIGKDLRGPALETALAEALPKK